MTPFQHIPVSTGDKGPYAYVILVWGESPEHVLGAIVLGGSIVRSGTSHDLICLVTPEVPASHRTALASFWMIHQVEHVKSSQRLFSSDRESSRFKHVFTKLQAMSLTQYEKVLVMDTDTLVLQNIDGLFQLVAPAAMRRGFNYRRSICHGDRICGSSFFLGESNGEEADWSWCQGGGINAGVMLLRPNWNTYKRMVWEVGVDNHPAHIPGNGPEQDYLSRFWCDAPWTHIAVEYNFQLHQLYNALSPATSGMAERCLLLQDGDYMTKIKVVHFSGELKPGHRFRGNGLAPADDFAETLKQQFRGYWLWVLKDETAWQREQSEDGTVDGIVRGSDGALYFAAQSGSSDAGEKIPIPDESHLHKAAASVVHEALRFWYDTWDFAQKRIDAVDLSYLLRPDENAEWCIRCNGGATKWCDQCWWKYEPPTFGTRITVTVQSAAPTFLIGGVPIQVPLSKSVGQSQVGADSCGILDSGLCQWFVFIDLDTTGVSPVALDFKNEAADMDILAERVGSMPRGRAAAVAAWGIPAEQTKVWSLLRALGAPDKIDFGMDSFGNEPGAFAMVGVKGLACGSAKTAVGVEAAACGRRVYGHISSSVRSPCSTSSRPRVLSERFGCFSFIRACLRMNTFIRDDSYENP